MSRPTKLLLMSLAVAGAISVGLLGFDLALVGAIALAICIVIFAVQLAIKLLKPTIHSEGRASFDDFTDTTRAHTPPITDDRGTYNTRDPALPYHLDPP